MKSIAVHVSFIMILFCPALQGQDIDLSALEFRHAGPYRGGRVTAVAGIAMQPSTYYMGSTGGGVWKTTDYGLTWKNVSDGFFRSPSIGAITVCQENPDIVYVGTGSDGLRSNVIAGKGMYKSVNAGQTWEAVGLEDSGHIGAVEIHPENPDVVYVAAIGQAFNPNEERGVFKTSDGGATWKKILFLSDTTGFSDLELAPDNPDMIYAAAWRAERKPWTIISGGEENGIFRSPDGGGSWQKIDSGLPEFKGKIDLAVSPDNPNILYALVEARDTLAGLYLSTNRGEHFELVSNKHELLDRPFYYTNIVADPQNVQKVYAVGQDFYRSDDGGQTWIELFTPHGDHHDLWINPLDSNLMVQSNDGGANISFNGGKTWTHQFNQPTAELYQVEVDNQYPYWLYAGQQDNYSAIAVPSLPPYSHQAGGTGYLLDIGGCETGPAVPHPEDPDIVYANCKGRFSVFNKRTGQEKRYDVEGYFMYGHNTKDLPERFQRVAPIHISPHDPSVIYHCSQHVWKTTNEGKSWERLSPDLTAFEPERQMRSGSPITNDITGEEFYSTIYSIRESSLQPGLIWVGANDGPVHMTRDGGLNWTNVTPEELPPGGRIDCVEPSVHDVNKAYFTALRYQLGDWRPYIYRTNNKGKSWKMITDGIPADHPVRVVREDTEREGLLFAGTEYGIYVSFDDGDTWSTIQNNLPITPVTDLKIHRNDLVLSTMGRGFWIMDNIHTLRQIKTSHQDHLLFATPPTIRYRTKRYSDRRTVAPSPPYPRPSVIIDYYLHEDVEQARLNILDENGKMVRSFSSRDTSLDNQYYDMISNEDIVIISDQLKTYPGLHRFRWDMTHSGPWHSDEDRAYRGGPMVRPGKYTVQFIAGDRLMSHDIELMRDPRIKPSDVSHSDLAMQEDLALSIVDLLTQVRKKAQILKGQEESSDAYDLLIQKKGRYTQPQLSEQINYLYGIVNKADQLPGEDAFRRYEALREQYRQFLVNFENGN